MHRGAKDHITIRDSIHGSIVVNALELKLIDHAALQRLRFIKQVGFLDLAFPGANHTRYAHSLGAMHIATRIFDSLFDEHAELSGETKTLFRQALRLASLCHDIGHGPLSHSSEALMPPVASLGLTSCVENRQATHEDFTLKLLIDSSFSNELSALFADVGVTPHHLIDLIFSHFESSLFVHKGIDYRPILQQIVSSECDADRMDYLQRDSVYCGVNYGKFDADWLIENLVPIQRNEAFYLGLRSRAVFSFEDFLLSRYHMFASVYLHHTPVIFDKMLELHFAEHEDSFTLPSDIESYVRIDDIELWSHLRKSTGAWAKRIVERRPFYLLDENQSNSALHERLQATLLARNIRSIRCYSKSLLSKYFEKEGNPIFVETNAGDIIALESYTPLYQRYNEPAELHRIFVAPEHRELAALILKEHCNEKK